MFRNHFNKCNHFDSFFINRTSMSLAVRTCSANCVLYHVMLHGSDDFEFCMFAASGKYAIASLLNTWSVRPSVFFGAISLACANRRTFPWREIMFFDWPLDTCASDLPVSHVATCKESMKLWRGRRNHVDYHVKLDCAQFFHRHSVLSSRIVLESGTTLWVARSRCLCARLWLRHAVVIL